MFFHGDIRKTIHDVQFSFVKMSLDKKVGSFIMRIRFVSFAVSLT